MKLYSSEHIFSHPWETVAKAAWRKYPNPINPAVVALDVLDRKVENGVLKTQRLISSSWSLPGWVATLLGTDQTCYVCEFSEVDPSKRTLTLKSRNLTLCNLVSVDERLSYSPHPDDSSRTLLKQEAEITIKGLPLTSYLEGVVVDTMSSKATQGRQALDWVIGRINNEVHELTVAAERGVDSVATAARRSMDDVALAAERGVDSVATAARRSMDDVALAAERGVDSVATAARRSMDDVASAARHGMGDIEHNLEQLSGSTTFGT